MRVTPYPRAVGPIGLGLLSLLCVRLAWSPAPTPVAAQSPDQFGLRPVRGPSGRAMREARYWHVCAMQEVSAQFDALQAWDPSLDGGPRDHLLWREMMACDRAGHLQRARASALKALQMAQGHREEHRARLLLARIECEAGDHQSELRQAHRLIEMTPRDPQALITLQRATKCIDFTAGRAGAERDGNG